MKTELPDNVRSKKGRSAAVWTNGKQGLSQGPWLRCYATRGHGSAKGRVLVCA